MCFLYGHYSPSAKIQPKIIRRDSVGNSETWIFNFCMDTPLEPNLPVPFWDTWFHPPLIGCKTMDPLICARREKNNTATYTDKTWSRQDWNAYYDVAFGIQDFESITEYFENRKSATTEAKNLRLARYYRNHLEHRAPVPRSLLAIMINLEAALAVSHPGYFDMNLDDIDRYLKELPDTNNIEDQSGTPPSQGVSDPTAESSDIHANEQSTTNATTPADPTQKKSKSQRQKKKDKAHVPPNAPPASNTSAPPSVTRPPPPR